MSLTVKLPVILSSHKHNILYCFGSDMSLYQLSTGDPIKEPRIIQVFDKTSEQVQVGNVFWKSGS